MTIRITIAAVLAALSFNAAATCANGATNYPTCTPPNTPAAPGSTSTSTSGANAAAGAAAGAVAGGGNAWQQQQAVGVGQGGASSSDAVGIGGTSSSVGHGGSGGSAAGGRSSSNATTGNNSNGATITDSSSTMSRNSLYVLPAPVFVPPMAKVECPSPTIRQSAFAIGWNFLSVSDSSTDTDSCTAITLYNAYVARCMYASAKQVQDLLAAKVLGAGFKPSDAFYLDLTAAECAALTGPAPVHNHTHITYESVHVPTQRSMPPPALKKPKKRSGVHAPCQRVCKVRA